MAVVAAAEAENSPAILQVCACAVDFSFFTVSVWNQTPNSEVCTWNRVEII